MLTGLQPFSLHCTYGKLQGPYDYMPDGVRKIQWILNSRATTNLKQPRDKRKVTSVHYQQCESKTSLTNRYNAQACTSSRCNEMHHVGGLVNTYIHAACDCLSNAVNCPGLLVLVFESLNQLCFTYTAKTVYQGIRNAFTFTPFIHQVCQKILWGLSVTENCAT